MLIPFRHVGKTPHSFELSKDDVTLKGTLRHKEGDLVQMQARLQGKVSVECDICAKQYDIMVDDDIDLLLYDGIYHGSEYGLDVVEMDGQIDMDELLHSETELIRSDYHRCDACTDETL
jgi:hypothetical protein